MSADKVRGRRGGRVVGRVAKPNHFNADRDPSFHFNTDPDPTFHFIAGPDLAQRDQLDANLRPLVYRSSRASF
jgi:hypothetical protein